jgi:hypothetical protein
MRRTVVAAIVVAVALGAGGCGGSEPLTRAEFVKRAEAVCTRVSKKIERTQIRGLEGLAQKLIALERGKVDGIGELEPPDGLRASVDQYLGVINDRSAFYRRALSDIRENGKPRQQDVAAVEIQTREKELATELHLRACATAA